MGGSRDGSGPGIGDDDSTRGSYDSHARSEPWRGTMAIADPTASGSSVLTESLIDRCGQRATVYDRENRFFQEDFDELRQAGYLLLAVPREFGGYGLNLAEVCQQQRRLAYRAPATAL